VSLGEDRVRIKFNPSNDSVVDQIKRAAADFIDLCETLRPDHMPVAVEANRCVSLAQTHAEDAAMWAVKAATADGVQK
jgi:hypothetical protein